MIPFFSFEKIFIFQTWGVFLALGILIPYLFVLYQAQKNKIKAEKIWDLFFWVIIGVFLGMRIGFVLQFPKYFLTNLKEIFYFWDGGLTFYGGLIGGLIGFVWYRKKGSLDKKEFIYLGDLIALYFPLGIIIARIGCFLINDHQGGITSLPWGIIWPDGTIRHPVALYLIINGICLFLGLNILKKRLKDGQLLTVFLTVYPVSRFFLDFTRSAGTEVSDPRFFNLTYSQWISLIFIFVLFLIKTKPLPNNRLK